MITDIGPGRRGDRAGRLPAVLGRSQPHQPQPVATARFQCCGSSTGRRQPGSRHLYRGRLPDPYRSAPAAQRSALIERLTADGGLHPHAVLDGIADALDSLIFRATRTDLADRLDSADRFLDELDRFEQDLPAPEATTPSVDPLTAVPGQHVDRPWRVERLLGTGATARTLLVSWTGENDDGAPPRPLWVLKVALDEQKAARLQAEAAVLEQVCGGVVASSPWLATRTPSPGAPSPGNASSPPA